MKSRLKVTENYGRIFSRFDTIHERDRHQSPSQPRHDSNSNSCRNAATWQKLTIIGQQLRPDEGPIFGASTTDPRFAVEIFLTAVGSGVVVPRRDGAMLDFYILFTITLSVLITTTIIYLLLSKHTVSYIHGEA